MSILYSYQILCLCQFLPYANFHPFGPMSVLALCQLWPNVIFGPMSILVAGQFWPNVKVGPMSNLALPSLALSVFTIRQVWPDFSFVCPFCEKARQHACHYFELVMPSETMNLYEIV